MQINIKNVEKLSTDRRSEDVLIRAIKNFRLKKEEWRTYLIMSIICLVSATTIGISENTVSVFLEVVSNLLDTFLCFFGIVFAGYTFSQALINRTLLIVMINEENKGNESMFKVTSSNFAELMMMYVVGIIVSLVIKFIVSSIPETYGLFPTLIVNNVCASALIMIYLFFSALLIWRMISFIYNIFQLFNLHAFALAKEIIDEEDKNI